MRKMGGWVDGARLPARLLFYPEGQALTCVIREAICATLRDERHLLHCDGQDRVFVDERHY